MLRGRAVCKSAEPRTGHRRGVARAYIGRTRIGDGPALIAAAVLAVADSPAAAVAGTMPTPPPQAATAAGPCEGAALATIAVRPGIGRAPATSGAVCVAAPGVVVIGFGYRDQATIGSGRQRLEVAPEPVALLGLAKRVELIVAPGLAFSTRTGSSGSNLLPAAGQQDAGFGAQLLLSDKPAVQQALSIFATLPTGYPSGSSGFTAGTPAYTFSYTAAINLGPRFGLATSQGIVGASGTNPASITRRFTAYEPTFNLSYALAAPTTLLLEDQITAPTAPAGPTGNRALFAIQQSLSPNALFDAEYECNLLPAPGFSQHALGAGLTFRL